MRNFITTAILFAITPLAVLAQHHQPEEKSPLSFMAVRSELLSDPGLAGYKMESSVMTILPGAVDTVAHRHDCELFGYVLEGAVIVGLDRKEGKAYRAGEMFYEKRNVLHTLTKNPDRKKETKVLLMFIIKEGRAGYTKEYN
jgi:quercetin dioxygenase-like cupin family protein